MEKLKVLKRKIEDADISLPVYYYYDDGIDQVFKKWDGEHCITIKIGWDDVSIQRNIMTPIDELEINRLTQDKEEFTNALKYALNELK